VEKEGSVWENTSKAPESQEGTWSPPKIIKTDHGGGTHQGKVDKTYGGHNGQKGEKNEETLIQRGGQARCQVKRTVQIDLTTSRENLENENRDGEGGKTGREVRSRRPGNENDFLPSPIDRKWARSSKEEWKKLLTLVKSQSLPH